MNSNLIIFFILSGAVFSLACCSDKETKDRTSSPSQQKTNIVRNDTLPPPAKPGLPPGHARVKGRLVAIDSTTHRTYDIMTLRVEQVMDYGSSTPPIATRDSIKIRTTKSPESNIKVGKQITLIIFYQGKLNIGGAGPGWTLAKTEDQ